MLVRPEPDMQLLGASRRDAVLHEERERLLRAQARDEQRHKKALAAWMKSWTTSDPRPEPPKHRSLEVWQPLPVLRDWPPLLAKLRRAQSSLQKASEEAEEAASALKEAKAEHQAQLAALKKGPDGVALRLKEAEVKGEIESLRETHARPKEELKVCVAKADHLEREIAARQKALRRAYAAIEELEDDKLPKRFAERHSMRPAHSEAFAATEQARRLLKEEESAAKEASESLESAKQEIWERRAWPEYQRFKICPGCARNRGVASGHCSECTDDDLARAGRECVPLAERSGSKELIRRSLATRMRWNSALETASAVHSALAPLKGSVAESRRRFEDAQSRYDRAAALTRQAKDRLKEGIRRDVGEEIKREEERLADFRAQATRARGEEQRLARRVKQLEGEIGLYTERLTSLDHPDLKKSVNRCAQLSKTRTRAKQKAAEEGKVIQSGLRALDTLPPAIKYVALVKGKEVLAVRTRKAFVNMSVKQVESPQRLAETHSTVVWLFSGQLFAAEPALQAKDVAVAAGEVLRRKQARLQGIRMRAAGVVRPSISQDVIAFVWQRDGGACVQCGGRANLEIDHIIPFSKGGSSTARNLQLLCEGCNREKSATI